MFARDELLHKLESELQKPTEVVRTPGDRWLLASGMQKAIRRGEETRAVSAAASLWSADKDSFWRRLHVTALEDVGVASPDIIATVLFAASSSAFRRQVGDLNVGLHLVRQLCRAAKTRVADELLIQAERAKCHSDLRQQFAFADDQTLSCRVLDERKPLADRCLALWFLFGTKRFPTDNMPQRVGSVDAGLAVLRSLDCPSTLTEACISVMSKTQWPLSVFTPLIWSANRPHTSYPRHDAIEPVQDVLGLPLYAADIFTRTGRSAYQQLRKVVPALTRFTVRQVGLGIFAIEGGLISNAVTSTSMETIRLAGEAADIEFTGLSLSDYEDLKRCLRDNMAALADLRTVLIRQRLSEIVLSGAEA